MKATRHNGRSGKQTESRKPNGMGAADERLQGFQNDGRTVHKFYGII